MSRPDCVLVPLGRRPRRQRDRSLVWIGLLAYVAMLEALGFATSSHAFTATTDASVHPVQAVTVSARPAAR